MDEPQIKDFCNSYGSKGLIRQRTCYKNSNNPTCIDLILITDLFWLNQINGHSLKYSESRVLSGLHVCFCLKNVTFLHSFCKRKYVGQAGTYLQYVLVVMNIYDSRLTFLFLVEAEGSAYLSKPEEF